jgi:hypothetical protein
MAGLFNRFSPSRLIQGLEYVSSIQQLPGPLSRSVLWQGPEGGNTE